MNLIYNIILFLAYSLSSGFGLIILKRAVTGIEFKFSLKTISDVLSLEFIFGFLLYAIGFICWMLILSKLKLNVAFPIAMSLFFIVSTIGSYFILNEPMSLKNLIGIIICLIGIVLISSN